MRLKFDEFFLNFYISRSSGGLTNHRAKKKIVEFLVKSAIPEDSWELLPTSDSSYEKWLNGTRTFNPAVWQEIAEKYDENRFLEIVIRELNDNALVTVMDRFGIKVSTVNEIDKELFTVAIGQQLREIARGTGSAEKVVQNIYSNTESKEIFPVYKQKALAEYSKVKTNFSDELCEMKDVFICNTLSTIDSAYSRRGMPARGTVIQDATLDKIAEQSNMVALIANGGMGKSMMLRHLFVESMKKYSETGVMPILVELRDFRFAGCDLLSCIVKSVSMFDPSFNDEAADKVLRAGKCQILLDGLDEIDPSDMAAFQHRLAPNGTAAIVCFPGIMYRGGAEKKIRQYLVDNNYIDCIIQLPSNLFFGTSISTCIMVLKKGKVDDKILFIDASKEFVKVTNNNRLTQENIQHIMDTYVQRTEIVHYAHVASHKEVVNNNYNLAVSTYVEEEDTREEIDIEDLKNRIQDIVQQEDELRRDIESIIREIEGGTE